MKILVVDDHPLILAALAQLLPRGERPRSVIGAADRDEAYAIVQRAASRSRNGSWLLP